MHLSESLATVPRVRAYIDVRVGAPDGPVGATIPVLSGATGAYNTQNVDVAFPAGTNKVYLVFRANPDVPGNPTANLFSLNWFDIVGAGVGTP